MSIQPATNVQDWDNFLISQPFSPFLQSWTMGEVYRDIGQEPIRLEAREDGKISAICQAVLVPARRGRHLMIHYGPVCAKPSALAPLMEELTKTARAHGCSFIRMSPFVLEGEQEKWLAPITHLHLRPAPLHVLAEHVWYLNLKNDPDSILMNMRKTTRNLIRRAEKEGVTIEASRDPVADLHHFIALHDETRKRHKFTPYTNAFFRAQVARFAPRSEVTLYLARYQGTVIASSIHMHMGGETSYHHGASSAAHSKIPASYLLQWRAIQDAIARGDRLYNFWGIAPESAKRHPFAGVTLFKTGFGGQLLNLMHCQDLPLSPLYAATRAFEYVRKWRRGF